MPTIDWRRAPLDFRHSIWLLALLVAWILAATMSYVSAFNAHPDEIFHARAADYHRDHWLPPKFGDPAVRPSYSGYGMSYVHDREIVYLLAGKWSNIFAPVLGSSDKSYRLFNLTLFAILIAGFAMAKSMRPLFVPLLLSAQVWYIFSYFNGDAFALAVAFLLAYQVSATDSAFNTALSGAGEWRTVGGVSLFGLALGLLLLAKENFYIFLPFLVAYVALRELGLRPALVVTTGAIVALCWYYKVPPAPAPAFITIGLLISIGFGADVARALKDSSFRRRAILYVTAAMIGLALFAPRIAYDKLVVESPRNALSSVTATAEMYAQDAYKPSVLKTRQAYSGMHMREHGISYTSVLFGHSFLWTSFRSGVGMYGWMKITAPGFLYVLTAALGGLFVLGLLKASGVSRDSFVRKQLQVVTVFAVLTVLMSSLHAWSMDFQAQGRYCFPILAMTGIALTALPKRPSLMMLVAVVGLYAAACYSFLDTGLRYITKT